MQVWNLTKLYIGIFLLRSKPYELPYSKALAVCLALLFIVLKAIAYIWFINIIDQYASDKTTSISFSWALFIPGVWVLILVAVINSTFLYYSILERVLQVITAFLAMDVLLTLLFLVWLGGLSLVGLPLASGSFVSAIIIFSFIFIMYWQFMVYLNILLNSMKISILKAGVFALFYTILQHNLAELLLNLVITNK